MHFSLEGVERHLPHHGVEHVLHLGGEQRPLLSLIRHLRDERAKGDHFAEDRRRLRERQRGRRHQGALSCRKHLMHAVAEFMRERHHVPRLSLKVQQHIGMRGGHGRMWKPPAPCPAAPARRSSSFQKSARRSPPYAALKSVVSLQHDFARLRPGIALGRRRRQRRAAIPIVERVLAEPFRLKLV